MAWMKSRLPRSASVAAAAALAEAACQTGGSALSAPSGNVPTLEFKQFATSIEDYRGQTIRTCGPRLRRSDPPRGWQLAIPMAIGHHPAGVRILACSDRRPSAAGQNCVTGRVARRDGSIAPVREGESEVISSAAISETWFLHAQCPPRRR